MSDRMSFALKHLAFQSAILAFEIYGGLQWAIGVSLACTIIAGFLVYHAWRVS